MVTYCELDDMCRRRFLLKHFDEDLDRKRDFDRSACCDFCRE
jgi:superfamily II DNA helicase RecQ